MLKKENYPTASCESLPISLRHLSPEDALRDEFSSIHCRKCGKDSAWAGSITTTFSDGQEKAHGYAVVCHTCHTLGPNRESPENAVLAWKDLNEKKLRECPSCEREDANIRLTPGHFFIECAYCGLTGPHGESEEDALEKWNTLPREREIRRLDKSCSTLMKQSDYLAEQLEKKAICRVKEVNGHMELSALTREDWLIMARKSAEGNGGAE